MAFRYLNEAESLADLVSRMNEDDKPTYNDFGHTRIEAVFDNRIFVLYKPQGLDGKIHKDPVVLTTIKVLNYVSSSEEGSSVEIEDVMTGQRQIITHIPARVFDYDLFMSLPPVLRLRWDARASDDGKLVRSMSYAVLIKSKNRSDWFSHGVTYAETPNRFREMFPGFDLQLTHY